MTNQSHRIRSTFVVAMAFLPLTVGRVQAADQWEISPYDVRVWMVFDDSPESIAWKERLPNGLVAELGLRLGAAWRILAKEVPAEKLGPIERLTPDDIESLDADVHKADKVFVVQFDASSPRMRFSVREFDCHVRRLTHVLRGSELQDARLPTSVADAVLKTFSPIGLVGRTQDDAVVIRMRSGLLDTRRRTPVSPVDDTMMRIVLRKSDRLGNPLPDGIETVAWTVLLVTPPDRQTPPPGEPNEPPLLVPPGSVHCQIVSGLRNPIRARGSRRVERFAIVTRPHQSDSTLELVNRDDTTSPLAGYDVYERLPGDKNSRWIGRTDWQGHLRIGGPALSSVSNEAGQFGSSLETSTRNPLRILYIKNGDRLLARLPVVIGADPTVTALLPDDGLRLEAEGFLKGIQEEFVDLVARREILAFRIGNRIREDRLDEAERLLDELRELPTRQDLERRIRERETSFQTRDKTQQDRINQLFRATRSLIAKHLSSQEIDRLRGELAEARREAASPGE